MEVLQRMIILAFVVWGMCVAGLISIARAFHNDLMIPIWVVFVVWALRLVGWLAKLYIAWELFKILVNIAIGA